MYVHVVCDSFGASFNQPVHVNNLQNTVSRTAEKFRKAFDSAH